MRQIVPPRNGWFLPALLLRFLFYLIVRLMYPVTVIGKEKIPEKGPVILIPNHVSYIDVVLLQFACPRRISYVAHEYLFRIWWLGWFLRMMGVVPIQPRDARRAFRSVVAKLGEGEVVCIFPEGQLSQTGLLQRLKPGFKVLAEQAGSPVQPVYINGIWGSVFTFARYRFFGKPPLPFRHGSRVNFGPLLQPGEEVMNQARETLLDLGAEAFARRPGLDENLGCRAIRALARFPWKQHPNGPKVAGRRWSRARILGTAISCARRLRATVPEKRVGVPLASGIETTIAHLAILLAGKSAVPLDRGRGPEAEPESKPRLVDFSQEFAALGGVGVGGWTLLAWVLPGRLLALLAGVARRGGDIEAVVVITGSATAGRREVVLTHRNILAGVEQLSEVNLSSPAETMSVDPTAPPGVRLTLGIWYAIIVGRLVSTSFQKEETAEEWGGRSGRFFRYATTGSGEARILEGYSRAEAAGAISLNLPDPVSRGPREEKGERPGSAGRLLPGITARIVGDDGKEKPWLRERGFLLLQGANLSSGGCRSDGWLATGEVAWFDEDGFLFFENGNSGISENNGNLF